MKKSVTMLQSISYANYLWPTVFRINDYTLPPLKHTRWSVAVVKPHTCNIGCSANLFHSANYRNFLWAAAREPFWNTYDIIASIAELGHSR